MPPAPRRTPRSRGALRCMRCSSRWPCAISLPDRYPCDRCKELGLPCPLGNQSFSKSKFPPEALRAVSETSSSSYEGNSRREATTSHATGNTSSAASFFERAVRQPTLKGSAYTQSILLNNVIRLLPFADPKATYQLENDSEMQLGTEHVAEVLATQDYNMNHDIARVKQFNKLVEEAARDSLVVRGSALPGSDEDICERIAELESNVKREQWFHEMSQNAGTASCSLKFVDEDGDEHSQTGTHPAIGRNDLLDHAHILDKGKASESASGIHTFGESSLHRSSFDANIRTVVDRYVSIVNRGRHALPAPELLNAICMLASVIQNIYSPKVFRKCLFGLDSSKIPPKFKFELLETPTYPHPMTFLEEIPFGIGRSVVIEENAEVHAEASRIVQNSRAWKRNWIKDDIIERFGSLKGMLDSYIEKEVVPATQQHNKEFDLENVRDNAIFTSDALICVGIMTQEIVLELLSRTTDATGGTDDGFNLNILDNEELPFRFDELVGHAIAEDNNLSDQVTEADVGYSRDNDELVD